MTASLLLERDGALAILTLNRPDSANTLDPATGEALCARIEEIAADASVGAVLLQATGAQFCAGGDIDSMGRSGADLPALLERHLPRLHRAILQFASLPVPVVTAVQGSVGGGGIALALCGDFILAGEAAKLRGGYTALGLSPDLGTSWLLARRIGAARAKEVLLGNRLYTAAECEAMGLYSQIWPDHALAAQARQLAGTLAQGASFALGRTKALVDAAHARSLGEHLRLEQEAMVQCARQPQALERIAAYTA